MKDLITNGVWSTAFRKEWGMAQGDNKTGEKGKNLIFVMTHEEIVNIPKVTYARIVVDSRPQKKDHNRIRMTEKGVTSSNTL